MVGLTEKTILQYRYDFPDSTFEAVAADTVTFTQKSFTDGNFWDLNSDPDLDKFGRPLTW